MYMIYTYNVDKIAHCTKSRNGKINEILVSFPYLIQCNCNTVYTLLKLQCYVCKT